MPKELIDKESALKKNVMITLTSVQRQDDDEESRTELVTIANMCREDGIDVISYEDTEATGFKGSVTTIKVDNNRHASIVRKGTANSVLSLEKGRKHFCQYGTPYGNMQIGVYTHSIDNQLADSGRLYLKYTLDLNSSYLSDNEIILTVQNRS